MKTRTQKTERLRTSSRKRGEYISLGLFGGLAMAVALMLGNVRLYSVAASLLWIAQRLNRHHYWIPYCIGMMFIAAGKYNRARAVFEQALKLNGESVPTWFAMGLAQVSSGRKNDAMRSVRQLGALDPVAAEDLAARVRYPDAECIACNNFRDTNNSMITHRLYKDGTEKITRSGGRILLKEIRADGSTKVRHATSPDAKWTLPPWAQ